jgi:glucose/arabinose dehydrogenase
MGGRRRRLRAVVAVAVFVGACSGAPAPTAAGGLVSIGAGLRGPQGLTAEVYTTGITNASALTMDDGNRLWVTSAAFDDNGQDALFVVDRAGAPPRKVIALHTPLGLLWRDGELYVASKERIDAYRGFDGTTFASHRTVITFPSGIGEVNGIVASPEGRIVVGISAPCDACTPALPASAAVVSFSAPDGSDLRVDASGIRAPIGLAYYPGTSDLLVTMNQRDDLGAATPGDWLALVRPGQVWGFPNCYGQGGPTCAGVPGPVATLDKHAAASGVAVVTGPISGSAGTSAIVAEWATGKVQRVTLTRSGGTYKGTVHPYITGITKPVPVLAAPDGSVLVGDWGTGTVYRVATR